jgi:hypothetical protein
MNAIIARLALPFLQFITQMEDAPGSGVFVPFPPYDPVTAASSVVLWEALRDHLDGMGTLSPMLLRVNGDRPRTMDPDLSLNGSDVLVMPAGGGSSAMALSGTLLNLGATGVTSATIEARVDTTPNDSTDDPDGFTDQLTGAQWPIVGSSITASVPGFAGAAPGMLSFGISVTLPAGLPSGRYPVYLTIGTVVSSDPARPELVTANNSGGDLVVWLDVP